MILPLLLLNYFDPWVYIETSRTMDGFGSKSYGINTIVLIYVEREMGGASKLTDGNVGFAF